MTRSAFVLAAVLELAGSAWADVNGDGYDWWRVALLALAALSLVLVVAPLPAPPPWTAVPGAAAAALAVVLTTQHFNDSYRGSRSWPEALACVFAAGVATSELALAGASPRRRAIRRPRARR